MKQTKQHSKPPCLFKSRRLYRVLFQFSALLPLLFTQTLVAADDDAHWWSGVTITPGIGLRHLGLDVTRKSDGFSGNIAQSTTAKLFYSISITSPEYSFGHSNWGISLRTFSSVVSLDRQFYSYDMVNEETGTNTGERIDVGTKVSGHYSYIVPAIYYKLILPESGTYQVAAGIGYWTAKLNGNIALTNNDNPSYATAKTDISLETRDQLAYLVLLSYTGRRNWIVEMTVGGPEFEDSNFRYQVEEVSISLGKEFVF